MRKVDLRMNEQRKYEIIKELNDHGGNKRRAAVKLNVTVRTIDRLLNAYKTHGKEAFMHKNRNRKPATAISDDVINSIVLLYENKYYDANWKHAHELIREYDGIDICYATFYKIMMSKGYLSPKCTKSVRKARAAEIKAKTEENKKLTPVEKELVVSRNILDFENVHPRLPRSKYFGELLEMDASQHLWFGNEKTTLHGAIDDATGRVYLYFDKQETLKGYYGLLNSILIKDGIPAQFVTDNRTVFYYNAKKDEELVKDTFTQFGYCCKKLGIDLKTTSIPQEKPRIERLWETLQSRLPVELRLAGIDSIEGANLFLLDYCEKFNKQFALPLNNIKNVFEKQPSEEIINLSLAILSPRSFDKGCSIRYQKNYYQAFKDDKLVPFKNKTKALVIRTYDGNLFITVDEEIYEMRLVPKHEENSEFFLEEKQEKTERKVYIPPMDHPWKRNSYLAYVRSLPHHQNYANA